MYNPRKYQKENENVTKYRENLSRNSRRTLHNEFSQTMNRGWTPGAKASRNFEANKVDRFGNPYEVDYEHRQNEFPGIRASSESKGYNTVGKDQDEEEEGENEF